MTTNIPPASEKQREAFEKVYAMKGYSVNRMENGEYLETITEYSWLGWKAALATLMPVLKQAEEALIDLGLEKADKAIAALREVIEP